MRGGIGQQFTLIVRLRNDCPVLDHDSTHGHFTQLCAAFRKR
jgi:hypothetical protein